MPPDTESCRTATTASRLTVENIRCEWDEMKARLRSESAAEHARLAREEAASEAAEALP